MDTVALEFIDGVVTVVAIILGICGLFLIFLDLGDTGPPGKSRRAFTAFWSTMEQQSWKDVSRLVVGHLTGSISLFVDYWFGQSERNIATSGIFLFIVLIAIPLAAVANMALGGSSFLFWVLAASLGVLVFQTVLGEIRRSSPINALVSVFLFGSVFLFVPGYVFVSFTDRLLNLAVGHAVFGSVLTVPLLYLVCHSLTLLSKVVLPAHGFYRHGPVFLASLPVVYILVFLTFLVSQFARADLALPKHWPMLLVCLAATGLSSAIVAALLRTAGNSKFYQRGLGWRCAVALIAAAILAVLVLILGGPELSMFARLKILVGVAPGGTAMQLGPLFWLMHLPFAPILAIMISFGVGYIAKFVVSLAGLVSGPAQPIQRPFFLNGLVMLTASIMLGAARWAT